ncbi:hypothetical protein [Bacillus pinisoli]|uniref:hypothetical protein n=1 Tax=Bacillus pinisoli TaxID=2901866 RepID=UPI001FF23C7F|nr:hypothetical protein [Bacillus pinisoli]
MSSENGHLENEVFYVTNEQYIQSVDSEEHSDSQAFNEKVKDAKLRLDLYKH